MGENERGQKVSDPIMVIRRRFYILLAIEAVIILATAGFIAYLWRTTL